MGEGTSVEEKAFLGVMSLGAEAIDRLIRENTKSADQRAVFILAACVAMLAYLLSRNAPTSWFYGPSGWLLKDYVSFASMLGLSISAAFTLAVLNPNRTEDSRASICRAKYRALRRGYRTGIVAAFLALLYLILATKGHRFVGRGY